MCVDSNDDGCDDADVTVLTVRKWKCEEVVERMTDDDYDLLRSSTLPVPYRTPVRRESQSAVQGMSSSRHSVKKELEHSLFLL
jgi:hypothetical protein